MSKERTKGNNSPLEKLLQMFGKERLRNFGVFCNLLKFYFLYLLFLSLMVVNDKMSSLQHRVSKRGYLSDVLVRTYIHARHSTERTPILYDY